MRKNWLLSLCLAASIASAQTKLQPTTTLTAETTNNTSAPDNTSVVTQGHAASGNISKLPMRSLLYPGAQTKIYAAIMGWFGKSSHMNIGYNSQSLTEATKQVQDMKSRGIDGAILAWYGKDSYENKTGLALKAAAEANAPFEFAIMIDRGTLDWDSMGLSPTDALIVHLNYLADNYYGSTAYARINGRPLIYEFALEAFTIDWTRVRASIKGNPMIIFRNPNGWTRPTSDGAYAWEPDKSTTSYLDYFYKTAASYPNQQTVGGASPSFNDTLAAWTQNRVVDPQCGQIWLMKWKDQSTWYSATKPLNQIQIATWNDYEEGSTIESGIDNCVNVTANVSGNTLTWALSGAGLENTIDHYTVFISADGENLMPLADLPVGSRSFDLSSYQFLAGNYSVFVKAVAKPSLTNKMSNAATFVSTFVPNQPPNAQLALNASSLYAPSTITASTTGSFDPDGSIARSTIIWADGSTSAGPVASHAFGAGTYTITAIVTDNKGATASTSGTITILPAEVVISSPVDGTSLNSPVRVQAVANSGNAISTMTVFVDGMAAYSTAGASLTADVKISAGAHTITVQATDVVGAVTKNSVPINVVNLPPVAKLALSAVTAPTGTSITADASGSSDADGTIKSTAISFGDGTTVAGSAASHVYSTPGTYNVTVTVTDDAGASSTTSAPMTITNRAPAAKISMSTTSVYTNTAVMFSSSGSSDPDGIIASTGFDFGDGTSAVGTSVSHAYVKPGTYIAKVTVTDNLGASSSASATITVVNQNPTAKIGLSATSIFTGQSVNITSSGSSDPDGTIASIKINFGDGSSMAAASASHTYTVAGSYTISVTVTDNNGASSTATATIKVAAPGVTITKPAQNSTSTTTVNVVASAASPRPIASMIIYVDNVRTYTIYASSLNTNIALKPGTHTILVKAWEDVTGTIYQNSVVTTVK